MDVLGEKIAMENVPGTLCHRNSLHTLVVAVHLPGPQGEEHAVHHMHGGGVRPDIVMMTAASWDSGEDRGSGRWGPWRWGEHNVLSGDVHLVADAGGARQGNWRRHG